MVSSYWKLVLDAKEEKVITEARSCSILSWLPARRVYLLSSVSGNCHKMTALTEAIVNRLLEEHGVPKDGWM